MSKFTTQRLSLYLRCLEELIGEGAERTSSKEFASRFNLNSAQIRKDLATFGEFGIRGIGYDVAALHEAIRRILGIDRTRKIVICGAGNLGLALADHEGFNSHNFQVIALLDLDPAKVGQASRTGIPVRHSDQLGRLVANEGVEIGVIAVPIAAAQRVYDRLADAGVSAVLNFSPVRLKLRPEVKIKSVDLRISLEALSFHLALPDAATPEI